MQEITMSNPLLTKCDIKIIAKTSSVMGKGPITDDQVATDAPSVATTLSLASYCLRVFLGPHMGVMPNENSFPCEGCIIGKQHFSR